MLSFFLKTKNKKACRQCLICCHQFFIKRHHHYFRSFDVLNCTYCPSFASKQHAILISEFDVILSSRFAVISILLQNFGVICSKIALLCWFLQTIINSFGQRNFLYKARSCLKYLDLIITNFAFEQKNVFQNIKIIKVKRHSFAESCRLHIPQSFKKCCHHSLQ